MTGAPRHLVSGDRARGRWREPRRPLLPLCARPAENETGAWSRAAPLGVEAPFHLEATVRLLQRRPANRVDLLQEGRYRRVLATADGLVLVEVWNAGSIDAPHLRYAILGGPTGRPSRAAVVATLRRVLGLDVDPGPFERLARRAPRLRGVARALRGMRPPRFPSLFETFARVVPFQQLSLDAGTVIVARLVERFGATVERGDHRFFAFPELEAIAGVRHGALRAIGLSRQKAATLRRAARLILDEKLREEEIVTLRSDAALAALMEIDGIGPWSAALILLRGFGRLDVFPAGDVGATRGLSALLDLPDGRGLEAVVERFGARRGFLYFCSLGAQLLERGLIAPALPRGGRGPTGGRP
ncbi:MAG TPA: AlkA N-terminal domain-containing protein [Planctomycetota bacterium]|nr:AlkA N-terminal domain-containing protein [Planctomycetota bacterium]